MEFLCAPDGAEQHDPRVSRHAENLPADQGVVGVVEVVHVVAVATRHAGRMHLTLQERAIDEDLIADLTVGEIQGVDEERGLKRIEQGSAGLDGIRELTAPCVTPYSS